MEKPVDATYPTSHITTELVAQTIPQFVGEQWQTPPAFSAIQINGKRAYEFARKGEEVELKPRLLVIDEIEVLRFDEQTMQLTIRVVCSKGTYIRALARDIGERLGSGAYLTALRRTRIGDTRVENCYTIEQFLQELMANG
jgi:tRNA pseudouridine55 synthase